MQNRRMAIRSGNVESDDKLVAVIYDLLRDHISPGAFEKVMQDNNDVSPEMRHVQFTNGWLASYAKDIAERLRK